MLPKILLKAICKQYIFQYCKFYEQVVYKESERRNLDRNYSPLANDTIVLIIIFLLMYLFNVYISKNYSPQIKAFNSIRFCLIFKFSD